MVDCRNIDKLRTTSELLPTAHWSAWESSSVFDSVTVGNADLLLACKGSVHPITTGRLGTVLRGVGVN